MSDNTEKNWREKFAQVVKENSDKQTAALMKAVTDARKIDLAEKVLVEIMDRYPIVNGSSLYLNQGYVERAIEAAAEIADKAVETFKKRFDAV